MTEMEPLAETREALAELVSFDDPDVDELLHDLGERARGIVPQLVGLSLGLAVGRPDVHPASPPARRWLRSTLPSTSTAVRASR